MMAPTITLAMAALFFLLGVAALLLEALEEAVDALVELLPLPARPGSLFSIEERRRSRTVLHALVLRSFYLGLVLLL